MEVNFRYGEIAAPKYDREQVTLIFNALNGTYLSATSVPYSMIDTSDPLCIYIVDEMNLIEDKVDGGLDVTHHEDGKVTWKADYKIRPIDDGIIEIHEKHMNNLAAKAITDRYPVAEQINILARAIKQLSAAAGVELEELEEYLDHVREVKDTNRKHIEHYKSQEGYRYVTASETAEQERLSYEGGIHERLGGREISGGRVFS